MTPAVPATMEGPAPSGPGTTRRSSLQLPTPAGLHRYAAVWCKGKRFVIRVAENETVETLKAHFRETIGCDQFQALRWYHAKPQ